MGSKIEAHYILSKTPDLPQRKGIFTKPFKTTGLIVIMYIKDCKDFQCILKYHSILYNQGFHIRIMRNDNANLDLLLFSVQNISCWMPHNIKSKWQDNRTKTRNRRIIQILYIIALKHAICMQRNSLHFPKAQFNITRFFIIVKSNF